MDVFKKFLDDVCLDREYKYERVERLAEIYLPNDVVPIATVESKYSNEYHIRFRIGITSLKLAQLVREMTLAESCLVFEEDFIIHPEYGYLYGDDARQAFIERLQNSVNNAQINNEIDDGAFFISENPIFYAGEEPRTKYQKMWDENE